MSKLNTNDSSVCPVFASRGKCDEDDALKVMEQFKEFYESKLNEVDLQGGGDCLEMKLKIQQRWIEDLTEQTHMMARVVKELEDEATNRVHMLEDKLKQTSKSAYEVMKRYQAYSISHNLDEPFQKTFYLENDLKNVLEFVRRVREDKKWSIDGLRFYDVTYQDLFGREPCDCDDKMNNPVTLTNGNYNEKNKETVPPNQVENSNEINKCLSEKLLQQLKKKDEEYEELRRSMLDMRTALTEEVACKHDMISALKKDIQQLEERCVQSDKQTAFKDDIIKELRKEIKQLKHQENVLGQSGKQFLNDSIQSITGRLQNMRKKLKRFYEWRKLIQIKLKKLQEENNSKQFLIVSLYNIIKGLINKLISSEIKNKERENELMLLLEEARSTVNQAKPCTKMVSTCTDTDDQLVIKKSKLIQNKDDIIQIQNDTLNVIELELQSTRKREKDLEEEICRRQCEVEDLKCKCVELEKALTNTQGRAENLQKAVDLYINSINVLEASEEKARIEIEQQKITISNLQEALVGVKQELDELRQSSQHEVEHHYYLSNVFYVNLMDMEERNNVANNRLSQINEVYKKLQECTFELEIEHFNALQDLAVLETQLCKYQSEIRLLEGIKTTNRSEIKSLRQQNRYYEHVIDCFKHEMTVMSEQLVHLQEILNLSNQSCKEENGQLQAAVVEMQKLVEKLHSRMHDTEKKFLIENQKNQLKDAKIDELQLIIGQKNADLSVHDEAINEMKMKLEHALIENHELQNTIATLNSTIVQLQCCIKMEKAKKTSKSKSIGCKRSLSDCAVEWERKNRKVQYLDQYEVKTMQNELERVKEKNKEKIKHLKRQNDELKEKLATRELSNERLHEQLVKLKEQINHLTQNDCCREHELTQSKQIIIELRQTLIELNESLAEGEHHHMALIEEYQKNKSQENEDIYLSCKCEIALYKKLAESLKESFEEATKKLRDAETRNRLLSEELKMRDMKVSEIQRTAAKKEKESCQCIEELNEKLKESQEEERRLSEFIDSLKQEVQKKITEKKEMQRIIKCHECGNINSTHEEINSLKVEIKNMIQNQLDLNNENDRLLKQVTTFQSNIVSLEDKNRHLKQKVDKLQSENHTLREKNKLLLCEKDTYLQAIRNLELELAETKNVRDDICAESRHVVNNVKAWLEEQRKINEKIKQRNQCYCNTIAKLKQENENLLTVQPLAQSTGYKDRFEQNCSNWCLGSQGSGSFVESPRCNSPSCSVEEWYSPNFRDEDTEEEGNFLNTVEVFTDKIRNKNKKWKNKCPRACGVSKDNE